MKRTILRTVAVFVGGHLVLGMSLLVMEATRGIDDREAGFALALAFYFLNLPTIWLFKSGSGTMPSIAMVLAIGTAQWTCIAVAVGAVLHSFMAAFRHKRAARSLKL